MNEIEIKQNNDIIISSFRLLSNGVVPIGNPTYEQWESAIKFVQRSEQAVHFWLGDLLNLGNNLYGEKYTQAVELTGFDYGTLANDSSVARAIPQPIRKPELSFEHHRVVAKLNPEDQEKWLDKAVDENLTVKELRRELNGVPKNDNSKHQALVDLEIAAKNFCEKFGISRDELAIIASLDDGERLIEGGNVKTITEEIKTKLKFMFGK
jgi:hypothetical protein